MSFFPDMKSGISKNGTSTIWNHSKTNITTMKMIAYPRYFPICIWSPQVTLDVSGYLLIAVNFVTGMGKIIIGVIPPPRPPRYLEEETDTIIISVICQKSLKKFRRLLVERAAHWGEQIKTPFLGGWNDYHPGTDEIICKKPHLWKLVISKNITNSPKSRYVDGSPTLPKFVIS